MSSLDLEGSSPPLVACFSSQEHKEWETIKDNQYRPFNFRKSDFGTFLRVQKNLSDETVKKHVSLVGVFLSHCNGCIDARSVMMYLTILRN